MLLFGVVFYRTKITYVFKEIIRLAFNNIITSAKEAM